MVQKNGKHVFRCFKVEARVQGVEIETANIQAKIPERSLSRFQFEQLFSIIQSVISYGKMKATLMK